jgi:ribonucleotide reductase beta subunit family protein with ferritin-like domain
MKIREPILEANPSRFVVLPIKHHDIWKMYKTSTELFWLPEEIDLSSDQTDWEEKLNNNERHFIKSILAFFAASDGMN